MTQPEPQEQFQSSAEENIPIYQLAVNMGFRINWDAPTEESIKKYHFFRREIESVKGKMHMSPGSKMAGDYDKQFYDFFTTSGIREDVEILRKSILEAKISKEVCIDELFSKGSEATAL